MYKKCLILASVFVLGTLPACCNKKKETKKAKKEKTDLHKEVSAFDTKVKETGKTITKF